MATKKQKEEVVSLQGITSEKQMEKEISKLSATDLIGLLANNSGTDSGDLLTSIAGSLISTDTSSSTATTTGKTTSMKVTADEKKLVQAYRKASESKQKEALELLAGEGGRSSSGGLLDGLLGNLLSGLFKK